MFTYKINQWYQNGQSQISQKWEPTAHSREFKVDDTNSQILLEEEKDWNGQNHGPWFIQNESSFITRTFYHVKCTNVWVSEKSLMDSPMVYGVTKCSYLNKYLKINKLIHLSWIVKIGVENVYSNNILLCFTVSHHTRVGGERDYNNNNTLLHLYLSHHTSPRCYDMISTRIFNV